MDASKALMIVAVVAAYRGIRFISRSLHAFHQVTVDSSRDDAFSISMNSSSSSSLDIVDAPPLPATKHDVFLSFRGDDTRDSFTSHLYEALCRAKIQTFIDNQLGKGEQISEALLIAIEKSEIYVIVFSIKYASSTWCLDELVKILECRRKYGRPVIPIFYNIDPSNIRKQSGIYRDAFIKHEQRFKNKHKVQRWKDALTEVSNLSGWDFTKLRPESTFIAKVVDDILKKLNCKSFYHYEGLVGIHPHIKNIEALLYLKSPDVLTLGIWGMGGIGKTTIAQIVFDELNSQFESCYFVAKVREQIARIGLDKLQNEYLSKLLGDQDFGTYSISSTCVKNRLQRKKILLVLDDLDNSIQVEDLIKLCGWFGLGSRIIITSRDLQVLKIAGVYKTYHVQEMNYHNALELFSLKAFKQCEPNKSFAELSEEGVKYCQGVPLALKVLGSFLYGSTKDAWESALQKFRKAQFLDIFYALKLSFDGLDEEQKNIFLDMACFFRRRKRPSFGEMEDYYGLHARIDMTILFERCLITIDKYGEIVMHDLVEAMGQEVARQQSNNELGKPVRPWQHEDIYHILKNKKGVERIRSMSLDMCKVKRLELAARTFEKMYNIRFLHFYKSDYKKPSNVYISKSLKCLPEELKIFRWEEYPSPSVPLRFCAENLVWFSMPDGNLQQLWDGDLHFPNLKLIDVAGSKHLVRLPDLSQTPNIQTIYLEDCVNLVQVHSSNSLIDLHSFHMLGCFKLRSVSFGSDIHPTSSKLLFVNSYWIPNMRFLEVSMEVLISQDGNICGFKFESISVLLQDRHGNIYDIQDEELKCLASSLPFVPKICWLDFPSSVEIGTQHLETHVKYFKSSPRLEGHVFEVKLPERENIEDAKGVTYPSMKGTRTTTKDVVLCLEEPMDPKNITVNCDGYCGLSKIYNISRWSLLSHCSLQRSKKVRSRISRLKCRQSKFEFTFSFSSEWATSNLTTTSYPSEMYIVKHNVQGDFHIAVDSNCILFLIPY